MNRTTPPQGTTLVLMTAAIIALMASLALAIDFGYFLIVRNQLQNGTDAAALAGAQGLAIVRDYGADGLAKRMAVEFAAKNLAAGQAIEVSPDQVTFPQPNIIRVESERILPTIFGAVIGKRQVSVRAVAAAAVVASPGGTGAPSGGWRPLAIPDQFANGADRVLDRAFDGSQGDYYLSPFCGDCSVPGDTSAFAGVPLGNVTGFGPGLPTGYITPRDSNYYSMQPITLKLGDPQNEVSAPGQFYPIDFPPNTRTGGGAEQYREYIRDGWRGGLKVGDRVYTKTGMMAGPTGQGIQDVCNLDPNAQVRRTEGGTIIVQSPIYPVNQSPRILPVPMFDPRYPPGSGKEDVVITNLGAFFVDCDRSKGDDVTGFFLPIRVLNGIGPRTGSEKTLAESGTGLLTATVVLIQ